MAYLITDFEDLQRSILAELKIPVTDTIELARVQQDINEIYLGHVAPYKRWEWLRKKVWIEHKPFYGSSALTATVTPDSTTVTLSATISTSKAGYFFATDNYSEIYYITSHTAGTATLTLSSPWTGAVSSTANFKIWRNFVPLPVNCRETFEVYHRFNSKPLEAQGIQEFTTTENGNPRLQGRPAVYSTDDFIDPSTTGDDETESDRYRILRIYPSLYSSSTTLEVHYTQDVTPLTLDGDEPLMPIHDRNVLKYGALALAWSRQRNEEAAARNWQLFYQKLDRMAGKVEDSVEKPQIVPSSKYILQKRGSRLGWGSSTVATGSAGYSSPTYIKDAEIATGNTLTGNLAVSDGITIDGVDISELAADLTVLTTLQSGKIIVGDSSDEPQARTVTGDITLSDLGVTSISAGAIVDADISGSADITRTKLVAGTAYRILANNASGAISENAAITASSAVVSDSNGQLVASAITATEVTYLDDVEPLTSATLTDNTTVTAASWAHASFNNISISYSLKRSTALESGIIRILTDGSSAEITQFAVLSIGTMGVTFSADISGANVRLRAAQSSTGTDATMKYSVQKHLN